MTDMPDVVEPTEILGRAVFDSSKAADAIKGKIHPKVFRERAGIKELSTDRLNFADKETLIDLHDTQRAPRQLQGWATITCAHASEMRRVVEANEVPGNPWHADIILPLSDDPDPIEEQKAHSLNLANLAKWQPRV